MCMSSQSCLKSLFGLFGLSNLIQQSVLTADGELRVASRGLDIKLQVSLSVLVNPENKTPKHRLNHVVQG